MVVLLGQKFQLFVLEKRMGIDDSSPVSIVDVRMPFWSMVVFMVKAAIAAIPAVVILTFIGSVVMALLGVIIGGTGRF